MRVRSEDPRPPCSLSSKSRPQPPSQGRMTSTHTLAALRMQTLDGFFNPSPDRRRNVVQADGGPITGSRSAVVVPCPPLPVTPPSSTINPAPLHENTPQPDSKGKQSKLNSVPASPSSLQHAPEEKEVQERETRPVVLSTTDEPATPERSPSLTSMFSHGSLSDLSHPPSSLFSRSTDLASGRSSVLSADIRDSDQEGGPCLSSLQRSGVIQSPLASCPPPGSNPRPPSTNTTAPPVLCEPLLGQTKPLSPCPTSDVPPLIDITQSRRESPKTTENLNKGASLYPGLNPYSDSDRGPITLAFPSTTWSSCPSPQRTTPRSGSGPKLTPSASLTRLESHRWPVLPPISPVRGRCGTAASRSSELSCSQSHVFDELEAIAPRSTSCPSLDEAADSSGCPSPDTEFSSGLAALTVGCDSGNLGSLSRVQLLLLDRLEPENLPSPFGMEEEQDWDLREQYDPELDGVLRPLTAGSISERCDSPGKVQENKSDQSEGGSGSPSSWIIDPSPSHDMFRSASPPGSSIDDGGPNEEESGYPGWGEEKDRRMEERKTKALSMLSKLQDDRPRRQANGNKSRSNFEDFDFLAKYCIFSQEKLAEYKRAFEAEDSDADGYISCLQVLLALKNIIPPELLSDEEEIYVYRILEMVDFRVTDGLVDLRLFAVISSLAQKIATMDEFMRSLISNMDFRSLEVRLFKAKLNELVVGDTSGKLHVYKNDDSKPWITRTCVGMLTCVAVGDVCNKGRNFVVAVGAEGWFHLFDLTAATASKSDSSSQHEFTSFEDQKPLFTQHIPANTKVILISDIDGDGRCELVVGYTDRVVRAFRWEEPSDGSDVGTGQLVLLKKWLLEGQVDSLSVNPGPEGLPELMVSQPGCGYAILLCSWTQHDSSGSGEEAPATPGSEGPSRDVILHLTTGRIHNKNVSTHLIGSISKGSKEESSKCGLFALCTLDGTLKLMDSSEQLLWSVQVDHQLFALQKLDVTGDGREEVVACAWDGQTYIIDHNRTVVRFQFDENVNAFCAGQYTCKEGKNSPCLVYVSFSHKIYVYWKVELEHMESTNLLRVLEEKPEFKSRLRELGVDTEDPAAVRSLVADVLYKDSQT